MLCDSFYVELFWVARARSSLSLRYARTTTARTTADAALIRGDILLDVLQGEESTGLRRNINSVLNTVTKCHTRAEVASEEQARGLLLHSAIHFRQKF